MHRRLQFGIRENPASSRRHGSSQPIDSFPNEGCTENENPISAESPLIQTHSSADVDSPLSPAALDATAREQFNDLPGFPVLAPSRTFMMAMTPFSREPKQLHPRKDVGFEPLLNASEAAQLLRIHPKTLQRLTRAGYLPAFRVGKFWRYRASDLEMWLRSGSHSKGQLADRVDFTKEKSQ